MFLKSGRQKKPACKNFRSKKYNPRTIYQKKHATEWCSKCGGTSDVGAKKRNNFLLPVVVGHTVDFMIDVNSKWNPVQAFIANTATEASRMIRLSHGL